MIKVTDREGKETGYTYDAAGNMTEVLRANQTSAKLTYDAAHQVTEIQNRDANGLARNKWKMVLFKYWCYENLWKNVL